MSNNNNFDSSEDNTNQYNTQLSDDLKNKLRINERRCMAEPLYGKDLRETCKIFSPNKIFAWAGGRLYCLNVLYNKNYTYHSDFLKEALYNPTRRIEELKDIFDRFILYIPAVNSKGPEIRVCHPSPSRYYANQRQQYLLQTIFSKAVLPLHQIATAMMCQFPDTRLIQYDCGKLQKLAELLRKLKNESHRALVFTQMTKMLDVLEFFLNYHGYIYLRMDGTTKIDQRQILLDRFNNDQRIFAFILSTRSGGIGINLTGADTVIFYDSDWNPTMDAQAQDRCHRIGQTRDVHIYRLISEKTIEENILKKANQKELLCNLAIDGGNFTTSYFTNHSAIVEELFTIDQTLDSAEKRIGKKTSDIGSIMNYKLKSYEKALAACEDDQDFQATEYAEAEVMANLMEFDENVSPKTDNNRNKEGQVSKEEQEINQLIGKLSAIEKYALRFIEHTPLPSANIFTARSKKQIELKKRLLEFNQKRVTQKNEAEPQQQEFDENKIIITYSQEDSKKVKTKTQGKLLLKRKKETEPTKLMPKRSKTKPENRENTMSPKLRSSIRLKRKNNDKAISSKSDAEENTVIKDAN